MRLNGAGERNQEEGKQYARGQLCCLSIVEQNISLTLTLVHASRLILALFRASCWHTGWLVNVTSEPSIPRREGARCTRKIWRKRTCTNQSRSPPTKKKEKKRKKPTSTSPYLHGQEGEDIPLWQTARILYLPNTQSTVHRP